MKNENTHAIENDFQQEKEKSMKLLKNYENGADFKGKGSFKKQNLENNEKFNIARNEIVEQLYEDTEFFLASMAQDIYNAIERSGLSTIPSKENVERAIAHKKIRYFSDAKEDELKKLSGGAAQAVDGKYDLNPFVFYKNYNTGNKKIDKFFERQEKSLSLQKVMTRFFKEYTYFDSHNTNIQGLSILEAAERVSITFEKIMYFEGKKFSYFSLLVAIGLLREALWPWSPKKGTVERDYATSKAILKCFNLNRAENEGFLKIHEDNKVALTYAVGRRVEVIKTQMIAWILGRAIEEKIIDTLQESPNFKVKESSNNENMYEDIDLYLFEGEKSTPEVETIFSPVSVKTGATFSIDKLTKYRHGNTKKRTAPDLYVGVNEDTLYIDELTGQIAFKEILCYDAGYIDAKYAGDTQALQDFPAQPETLWVEEDEFFF